MMLSLLALLAAAAAGPAPLEGRPIAAVRVDAPPEQAARIERYTSELKPGSELSAEQVRHVVELIHATGDYADVQVEARALPEGVELVVRPAAAPLMTALAREGDAVLTVKELRRITRLHQREALWPARLLSAASDVTAALRERGFPRAQVSARSQPAAGEATAVFAITAGARQRVGRAQVAGVNPALQAELEQAARPRPGRPWIRAQAVAAAERMRRTLVRRGRWGARVELREAPSADGETVDVVFSIDRAGLARVEFTGAPLPEGVRGAVLRVLREGALQADALEEASERLEEAFLQLGHREVSVSREQASPGGEEVLTYRVQPGAAAVIGSLRVATDEVSGLERLLSTRLGAPLVERALSADALALRHELEARGYAQAQVQVETPDGAGALPVVFRVREGPLVLVGSVRVVSPAAAEIAQARELRLRGGQPYRVADLGRDSASVLTAYRDAGYPQVEVTPEVTLAEGGQRADVALHVRPGPRVLVDHIVTSGLTRTRESVVRRELQLEEGQPLGLQKVLESQRRLSALGIFERVGISELDPEAPERRSLVVSVQEAPQTTVAYGIGYAERDLLRGSVEVTQRNLFGLDRSLSTFASVSFRGSRLFMTFREPYLLGRHQELFLTGFREEEDRDFFDFERWGGLVQAARELGPSWNLIFRYTYQRTHSFNIVDPDEVGREFSDSTLSGPAATVVLDTRDDPLEPSRGRFASADLQLSLRVLGGDSFAKGFLQAATYQRLAPRAVAVLSARLGLARTFGLSESLLLPPPDRFYAGGDYSLRGFAIDTVNPLGGNALLLGGAEVRLDLWRGFSTATFLEAGNVYGLVSQMDVANLRYTAGLGLRYKSAFGPIRVDYGWKLDRRPNESPGELHVTIGHAF